MKGFSSLIGTAVLSATLTAAVCTAPDAHAADKVYTLSDLEVVKQVVPEYPRRAAAGGFDGWVELEFTVTPTGEVSEAEVVNSSSRIFHRDALVALQGWRFQPVAVGGQAAPVRAQLRFTFQGQ